MKKTQYFILLTSFLVLFSSCFDITEELTLNKDGSGFFKVTIDALKVKAQLQSLSSFDSTGNLVQKQKFSLDSSFELIIKSYSTISGVSNLTLDTSVPYLYKISMNFSTINALNTALSLGKKNDSQNLYMWKKGELSRGTLPLFVNSMGDGNSYNDLENIKDFINGIKYTTITNLPNKIKKNSNDNAIISSNKTIVTLGLDLYELLNKTSFLTNYIKYK